MWSDFDDDLFFESLRTGPAFDGVGAGSPPVRASAVRPSAEHDARDASPAFGQFIRLLRGKKHLSRHSLAEQSGVPEAQLFSVEHVADVLPEKSVVTALADFFHLPQAKLLELAGVQPPTASLHDVAVRFVVEVDDEPVPLAPSQERALADLLRELTLDAEPAR